LSEILSEFCAVNNFLLTFWGELVNLNVVAFDADQRFHFFRLYLCKHGRLFDTNVHKWLFSAYANTL
jgi:hypothetical protein